uniref:Uncharacterized protein n=1 Tax=Junco hyemalis TaxID=40217 RepID=A0A8C5IJ93_JUNHY
MEPIEKEPAINYFPGHMNKALYQIKDTVHNADAAILILDSRAPLASFPYGLEKIIGDKPKVILLSKRDLADPIKTKEFIEYFNNKDNKFIKLNLPLPPVKCLVLGIPNTRKTTMFRATPRIWLYDTPGILEPNVHDRDSMIKLALLGSVKDDILPHDYLAKKLLEMLSKLYPDAFEKRYGIPQSLNPTQALIDLADKRGFILSKDRPDIDRPPFGTFRNKSKAHRYEAF